jgi:predicted GIY-YIG superfamily endonuclease
MTYLVYILKSDKFSYVGMTNDFFRRFRQHNKEIKGGAKYTSKRTGWYPICIIDGFDTMVEAMQCEWRVKKSGLLRGPDGRVKHLSNMLKKEKWTSKSPVIKEQNLTIYIDDAFKPYLTTSSSNNIKVKELYWK